MSLEENNIHDLKKVGINSIELELLNYINNAVSEMIDRIQGSNLNLKAKNCKELLRICSAIKQDILGDFPKCTLIVNDSLWKLLIKALDVSCCCDDTHSNSIYDDDNNSFITTSSNSTNSTCCLILKQGLIDLFIEMIKNTSKLFDNLLNLGFIPKDLLERIVIFTATVIPNVINYAIKNGIQAHCECKIETIVPIYEIIGQDKTSFFNENLMRRTRLWTSLFKLISCCSDINSKLIKILESEKNIIEFQDNIFHEIKIRITDSSEVICRTLTNIYVEDNRGIGYYSILAFSDIFSQFILYVYYLYKTFSILKKDSSDSYLKEMTLLLNKNFGNVEYNDKSIIRAEFDNQYDEVSDSKGKHTEVSFGINTFFNNESHIEFNSLLSCIRYLLINKDVIQVDSLRPDFKCNFRSTIIEILKPIFKNENLETLDSIIFTNQTLFLFDHINKYFVYNYGKLNNNNTTQNDDNYISDEHISNFIRSPNHTVSFIIFLLKSENNISLIQKHLELVLDLLFDLKDSQLRNLIFVTLSYLFAYIVQNIQKNKEISNITLLFKVMKRKVIQNRILFMSSPLSWISNILILREVYSKKNEDIFISVNELIREWENGVLMEYSNSLNTIEAESRELIELQKSIILCEIFTESIYENFNPSNSFKFILLIFKCFKRDRNIRRSAIFQLISILGSKPSFPKNKLEIELFLDSQENMERYWEINTKFLFHKYFSLIEFKNNQYKERFSDSFIDSNLILEYYTETNISPLKLPDLSQISKMLSVIKNNRIQTQIKISAIYSITESLTSTKIPFRIFVIYTEVLIKLLMQYTCQKYLINSIDDKNIKGDDMSLLGMTEIIYQDESSIFYHLSVAVNAIIVSRSYQKEFIDYFVGGYSLLLLNHLSYWMFSSSEECRCSSSSLLSTILIIILKTGFLGEQKIAQSINEEYLEETCNEIIVSSFLDKLLILPNSKKLIESSNKQLEVDNLAFLDKKYYLNNISKPIDEILNDIYQLTKKKEVDGNYTYLSEVIFSIFSLTFPWTKLTVFAVNLETCELKVKESIDSVFSKLIIFLNSANFQTLDDVANCLELLNISYFNIDLKLLSVIKIIYIILESYHYSDQLIFMENVSRYLTHFVIISSFFNSFFKEKNFDIHIGSIRPTVSLNIFDIICLAMESFEGKLNELFFEFLPDNIQWSFLVLQVPKLIDPLNSDSSPTTLMMIARLLSKMPLKRWLEENPRHTISCLKLLMNNKKFICNMEILDVSRSKTYQESSFVLCLLEIFEKLSVSNLLNHPLVIYLQKNLLKWLYVVGITSSSYEIQKRVWDLKIILLDRWEIEFSGNIYSLVSNMKISESLLESKRNERITWGCLISHSLNVITTLTNFLILDKDFVDCSITWRTADFCNYFSTVLRFLDMCLGIHYKPIKDYRKNNCDKIGDEVKLVSTTFMDSLENIVDTLFSQLISIIFNLEGNELASSEGIISNNLKLFVLKLVIAFFGKISVYLPFSSYIFKRFSENNNNLLLCINKLVQLNIENGILYSMISFIVNVIKIDSSNSRILQEQIYLILSDTEISKTTYSELVQLLVYLNELLNLENKNIIQLNYKLFKKIISLSIDFFNQISKFMFNDDIMNLINGFSILQYSLMRSEKFKQCLSNFDSEFKILLLTSIFTSISFIAQFIVEKSLIEDYYMDYSALQDLLLISISSLTIFKSCYYKDIMELLIHSLELRTAVLSIWSDCNKLIVYTNSLKIANNEIKLQLRLFIDYFLIIVTINAFSEVIINSILELDISNFVKELYNQWLYITATENHNDYSFYTLTYFSSFVYDIKVYLSHDDVKKTELRDRFNFYSFNIGFLNCILEKAAGLLVEFREVCLGELRSHTVTSIRATSNQKFYLYSKLAKNVFLSRISCLFQLLKIIGIYLSEFEGPINLFTNRKLKPLLTFVVESLALLNCITKQLDSEIERENSDGFTTCLKNWWLYTKKSTKIENDFDTFSCIFKQIISLTISCSSLIIPISDSKLLINESQNSVPLSDITRSQKQGSSRLHDLFLNLLESDSSIGLNLGIGYSSLPVEINEEYGNLCSNITQKELNFLNGNDLKFSQKNNLWLEGIVLNDSVPISIRLAVLRLFINLGLSSSRKKFFKHWRIDETEENIKILKIIEKCRLTKNMEFLALSVIFLDLILSYNSSPIFDSINKNNHCIYSNSQCKMIFNSLEKMKLEISTFKNYQEIKEKNPIIEKLIDKCYDNLRLKIK